MMSGMKNDTGDIHVIFLREDFGTDSGREVD
jgi:hypothetical protein